MNDSAIDFSNVDAPPFAAPWQAHAFAMAVKLHEAGLFTWREWAATLAAHIAATPAAGAPAADDPDRGHSYYTHWLAALEEIVARKGVATTQELHHAARAWDKAAHRTRHGVAIELRDADFS